MTSPSDIHLGIAKRMLKYIKRSTDLGIWYKKIREVQLTRYTNCDLAGCVDDSKSTSWYIFSFGTGTMSWSARKQDVVAQSTVEAEYMALSSAANQAIWRETCFLILTTYKILQQFNVTTSRQ